MNIARLLKACAALIVVPVFVLLMLIAGAAALFVQICHSVWTQK